MGGRWRPYALAPLKKQQKMPKFVVFDIETDEWLDDTYGKADDEVMAWDNRPIKTHLLTFYDGAITKHFDGRHLFKNFLDFFLTKDYRSTFAYVHNGGKFDFIAVWDAIIHDKNMLIEHPVQPKMQKGRIMAFSIGDRSEHRWHLRDSYSILPHSLMQLCDDFLPSKVKQERPRIPYREDKKLWQEYCAYDCYSLQEILQSFFTSLIGAGGVVGYTAGSIAMKSWRAISLDRELPTYFDYNPLLRDAYYGGRTEPYIMIAPERDNPYYLYDVNSMYPFVMANFRYPTGKPQLTQLHDTETECRDGCGVIQCHVIAPPDLDIPLLPFRRVSDGKLLFPLGEWDGSYECSEIYEAVRHGYDIKVKHAYMFNESDFIFKEYVSRFHKLKEESKGAQRNVYKLLLNSLYGKFGEKPDRTEIVMDPNESIQGLYPMDDLFGYCVRAFRRDAAHHLPAIALRVTALARLHLYKQFERIQFQGGRVFYCDTDSVASDKRIITDTGLGGLEKKFEFRHGIFLQPKTYYLEPYEFKLDKHGRRVLDNVACKGFSRHFRERMTYEMLEEALLTGDYKRLCERVVRPASLGEIRAQHLAGFVTIVDPNNILTAYDKREVMPDYTTRPFTIKDGETVTTPLLTAQR